MAKRVLQSDEAAHGVSQHRYRRLAQVPAELVEIVGQALEPVGGRRRDGGAAAAPVIVEDQGVGIEEGSEFDDEAVTDVVRAAMAHEQRRAFTPALIADLDPVRCSEARHRCLSLPRRSGSGGRLTDRTAVHDLPANLAEDTVFSACRGQLIAICIRRFAEWWHPSRALRAGSRDQAWSRHCCR